MVSSWTSGARLHGVLRMSREESSQAKPSQLALVYVCQTWKHGSGSALAKSVAALQTSTCTREVAKHVPQSPSIAAFLDLVHMNTVVGEKEEECVSWQCWYWLKNHLSTKALTVMSSLLLAAGINIHYYQVVSSSPSQLEKFTIPTVFMIFIAKANSSKTFSWEWFLSWKS